MTTTIAPSPFGQLMANPLLEGKVIKEGVYIFPSYLFEELEVGKSTILTKGQMRTGERYLTSPVQYWEFIEDQVTYGVIVTKNSIYKVRVLS